MTTLTWLQILVIIADIVASLAAGYGVLLAAQNLAEVRRQTALANDPILKIRLRHSNRTPDGGQYYTRKLHSAWQRFITNNLESVRASDDFISLELSNAGRSEITDVTLKFTLTVTMFEGPALESSLAPQTDEWFLNLDQLELGEGQLISIPLTNTRYFPIYTFRISAVSYRDIRNAKLFTTYNGPRSGGPFENPGLDPSGGPALLRQTIDPQSSPHAVGERIARLLDELASPPAQEQ